MDKKNTMKKVSALCLALALTAGATGCEFIITDGIADLNQIVATVNIADTLGKDTDSEYITDAATTSSSVNSLITKGYLSTDIPKRDLVASFMSTGYYYVNNYGYSYTDTFNMLMDELVNQKILTQYAVAYYLDKDANLTVSGFETYRTAQLDAVSSDSTVKGLLEAHPEVLTFKYFLTGGENTSEALQDYNEAVYSLKLSLNNTLDSSEKSLIKAETHEHTHEETRTTPTNANAETEEYYPIENGVIDYDVYTGRNAKNTCGVYETVEGSTPKTRKDAYNVFLSNLGSYNLIKEGENTADITKLDYYYMELTTVLGQALVTKFGEDLEEAAIAKFSDAEAEAEYARIYEGQQAAYDKSVSTFETALNGVSDTSFVLYGQKGFGFVYNILLPFSKAQEMQYNAAKNKAGDDQNAIFNARKKILSEVEGKDLRSAWFCEDEHSHYAYEVSEGYYNNGTDKGEDTYLFFENNFSGNEKYKTLTQYTGKYPFNGQATFDETEKEWSFEYKAAHKLTIDEFIKEMESYINYAVDGNKTSGRAKADTAWVSGYDSDSLKTDYYKADGETVDYSKFVYYKGQVSLTDTNRSDFFYKGTDTDKNDAYAALSAVNELMFAYSTDTGCLNTYMGYAVSLYKTSFVSEFEYAAQIAVQGGVGTYVVAPSDYGWHIIYCSFVYDDAQGDVYGGYKAAERELEGTFSNLFYESMKTNAATTAVSTAQNAVKNEYKDAAVRHVSTYQDLLDLDKA